MATQQPWRPLLAIQSQGDTSTASVISIKPMMSNVIQASKAFAMRVKVCDQDTYSNATNATIAVTTLGDVIETHTASKDLSVMTNAASQATETLTISGVVIDGETVTLGGQVYEFDDDSSVTGANIAADISSYSTQSQGTLTVDTQPTASDTMSIGGRTYVFVTDGTANFPGEINVGTDLADAKVDIVAAINGTDGYNVANTSVTAATFSGDNCVLTAITGGTAGDAIATTETFTAGTNVFDAATLGTTTAGVDCTAANGVTALVAAITGDGSAEVTAVDGAGDTVDVTAVASGVAGNSIASTETMANGAFGAGTLSGAEDVAAGEIRVNVTNATAETVTLRFGPPAILGVPAMDYTTSIDVTHAAP